MLAQEPLIKVMPVEPVVAHSLIHPEVGVVVLVQ
jgi:hypothetical protein